MILHHQVNYISHKSSVSPCVPVEGGEWEEEQGEEEEERGSLGKNAWNSFPVLQLSQSQ